ncbi:MAG: hypothetical protein IT324_04010 [Anaerolineae bacterium]|nr:hypothetical protein [Anaerolineae bacterium]
MQTPQSVSPPRDPSAVTEPISPYVIREWLYDKRIAVLTIKSVAREQVDLYVDLFQQVITEWPADQPFLTMLDLTDTAMTPYVRERMKVVDITHTGLHGYQAIVIKSMFAPLARIIMQVQRSPIQIQLYNSRQEGLNWLVSKLPSNPES